MVNGIEDFTEHPREIAREGVSSYLVWLPWCPQSPSATFNFPPLCVCDAVDNESKVCILFTYC